jgi:hypothetical protein
VNEKVAQNTLKALPDFVLRMVADEGVLSRDVIRVPVIVTFVLRESEDVVILSCYRHSSVSLTLLSHH